MISFLRNLSYTSFLVRWARLLKDFDMGVLLDVGGDVCDWVTRMYGKLKEWKETKMAERESAEEKEKRQRETELKALYRAEEGLDDIDRDRAVSAVRAARELTAVMADAHNLTVSSYLLDRLGRLRGRGSRITQHVG